MQIKNLTILGFSEATLSMIFDILESNSNFPTAKIVNNLNLSPTKEFHNKKFKIKIENLISEDDNLFVIGCVKPLIKEKIKNYFNNINRNSFYTLINKNSNVSSTTNIGNGVIINTLTCVAGFSTIKDFVFINRNCSIGHHTTINEFTTINPGVNISGNVNIGKFCQIGVGANIIDNISIGNNTIIGAGSLVTKDIPDNVVAYGSPCKIIRENVKHSV